MPVYTTAGGISGLPYGTILGRPVVETEYNPSLGTLGDILLISPSQYYLIDKSGGIQTASSIHVNFTTDETAFRFVYRVDGAPLWYTTLTGKDTNTYSPYVALAAST
jgi:HK97 family phage major capsid protein